MAGRECLSVCIIGGIQKAKGQDIAVQAISYLRNKGIRATLNVAGAGDLDWLQDVIHEHGLSDQVRLLGRVDSPWSVLASNHICLICSEAEAMGRVAAESMVAGTPIVATHGGATNELLGDGARGLLVARDANSVAQGLELAWHDYATACEVAEAAQAWARDQFNSNVYSQRVRAVYATCLKSRRSTTE